MKRFFVPLYKYFAGHKSLMWTLAAVLSVFSVFFGLKVGYEEDITKLLPASATSDSGLAFGNLKVKDKIFIQFASRDSLADTYTLASYADEFMDSLLVRDSASHYIDNALYRIDDDLPLMALDFVMEHLPVFVDTSCYSDFAKRWFICRFHNCRLTPLLRRQHRGDGLRFACGHGFRHQGQLGTRGRNRGADRRICKSIS